MQLQGFASSARRVGQEEEGEGRTVAGPIEWRRTAALIQRTLRVRAKLQARGGADEAGK